MNQSEEKQELIRLLESPHLRGERLQETLNYLCEKHWSGGDPRVTQYDIAEAILGNVEEVNGARNIMMRLRRQLQVHYADTGSTSPLQLEIPKGRYVVNFLEIEVDPAVVNRPTDKSGNRNNRRKIALSGRSLWILLAVASCLVALMLVYQHAFRRLPAETIMKSKDPHQVIGKTNNGDKAWHEEFPGIVRHVASFDENPATKNRFVVFCGGSENDIPDRVTPHVYILSAKGEKIEDIDLFAAGFNPFREQFREDYFKIAEPEVVDFDLDGFQDLIAECRHIYYPDILFFISGEGREIVGAFANSGHLHNYVIVPNNLGLKNQPFIVVAATNNMMGEQTALFCASPKRRGTSPDIRTSIAGLKYNYRPTGNIFNDTVLLSPKEDGTVALMSNMEPLHFAVNGSLSSDPCWRGDSVSLAAATENRKKLYSDIEEARSNFKEHNFISGLESYDRAEGIAEAADDKGLLFYVQMDAARTCKLSGLYEEALRQLPVTPGNSVNPFRVYLLKGKILMLQKNYKEAKIAFLAAGPNTFAYMRYFQASILAGDSILDIHSAISKEWTRVYCYPVTREWLLIPGILQGDVDDALRIRDGLTFNIEDKDRAPNETLFPQETLIWAGLAEYARGRDPVRFPDRELRPVKTDPLVQMKADLFTGYGHYMKGNLTEAKPILKKCYEGLKREVVGNERAIIPFVLAAYSYGFTLMKRTELNEEERTSALKALLEAYNRFNHGEIAQKARKILLDNNVDIADSPQS